MSGGAAPNDRRSTTWMQAPLDAAPFGFGVLDADLRVLDATSRFAELLGIAGVEGVIGLDLATLIGSVGPTADEIVRSAEQVLQAGVLFEGTEAVLNSGEPHSRTLLVGGYPIAEPDSGARVAITVSDVTARHRHEEALSGSFVRLSASFASALTPQSIGEVVVRAGIDGVGAVGGAFYTLDDSEARLVRFGAAANSLEPPAGELLSLTAELPICAAVRDGKAIWVHDLDDMRVRFPAYFDYPTRQPVDGGLVALPVLDGDRVVGGVVFGWTAPRRGEDTDRLFLEAIAALCAHAIRRAQLLSDERGAREHVERVADQVLRLERITGILAAASAPTEVINRFLEDCLPVLRANAGAVFEFDQTTRMLTLVAGQVEGESEWHVEPVSIDGTSVMASAATSRHSVLLENLEQIRDFDTSTLRGSMPDDLPEQGWAAIPLQAYGDLLGVVGLRFDGGSRFDTDDRLFLDRVGRRLAEALERSRLYAQQRDAREQAEAAARWLRSVQSLAAALARSATRRDVARAIREHLHSATRADFSIVATLSGDGDNLDVLTATSTSTFKPNELEVSAQIDAREALLRGRSIEVSGAEQIAAFFPGLARAGIESFALLPIRSGNNFVAALGVGWSSSEGITPDARRLLSIAVSLGGAAFERAAAYDLDHHIAETLQRHLLTEPDTKVPGVAWAARYAPGAVELTAGGDWYDVIALPEGRVALVVGDIVGHGINAAAAMGQIRSATRALAMRENAVGVLDAIDTFATATGQGNLSSIAYVVLDPASATLEFAVAGHPPPLLRNPDGSTVVVHEARGPLIGLAEPGTRRSLVRPFSPGSSIVLYTDGLVERRGESIDVGFARLEAALLETHRTLHPEGVCDHLLAELAAVGTAPDDITLLAVDFDRLTAVHDRLYPARPELLRVVRADVRAWLAAHDIRGDVATDVLLASGEAMANAIDHGSRRDGDKSVELRLAFEPSLTGSGTDILVVVRDGGSWPESRRIAQRGHGLDIMRCVMSSVEIESDVHGTCITLRKPLSEQPS